MSESELKRVEQLLKFMEHCEMSKLYEDVSREDCVEDLQIMTRDEVWVAMYVDFNSNLKVVTGVLDSVELKVKNILIVG